jgi:transposase-like protein
MVAKRRETAVRMVAAGKTRAEIAEALKVSETSVYNWLRAAQIERRAAPATEAVASPPPATQPGLSFGIPSAPTRPMAAPRPATEGAKIEVRTGAELDRRIAQIRSLSDDARMAVTRYEQALHHDAFAAFSAANGLPVERDSATVQTALRGAELALAALQGASVASVASVVSKTG